MILLTIDATSASGGSIPPIRVTQITRGEQLGATLRREVVDFYPRDLIDIQSFLWVQGSDEP